MIDNSNQDSYITHYKRGPFPGTVDPWTETGRYFHQIHNGMIHIMQETLQDQLLLMGYQAGKEASLQISIDRRPDIYVETRYEKPRSSTWDYAASAAAAQVEPGIAVVDEEPELDALQIFEIETGDLVTVVEIISPRNKTSIQDMSVYKYQRNELFLENGINVVEIDATRSIKRLLTHTLTTNHHYHIAIYLNDDLPRVHVNDFGEPLKRFALPLRGEVLPVETQSIYDRAYQNGAIAGLCLKATDYLASELPFPSTLNDEQRRAADNTVAQWKHELNQLRGQIR